MPLPHPQILQKLRVPIIDSEVCSRLYWRGAGQGTITEDMLCAGYLEGERDACLVSSLVPDISLGRGASLAQLGVRCKPEGHKRLSCAPLWGHSFPWEGSPLPTYPGPTPASCW